MMRTHYRQFASSWLAGVLVAVAVVLCLTLAARGADPLPSWNDGPRKAAILEFVKKVATEGSPDFVPEAERIATFDNDGTLWVEQPLYTQVVFALDRVKQLAPEHPEWKTTEPFQSLLDDGPTALPNFSIQDFEQVIAETHSGMTVPAFQATVRDWLVSARHPRFKRPYTQLVYQPMLELMELLRAHGFKTFMVTGGGQEFVRVFSEKIYGIVPENTVGSAAGTQYKLNAQGEPELIKLPKTLLIDDGPGKPEGINLMIGRRPIAAFGNSTGDAEMLAYTAAGPGARLMMLVHHDDGKREYDYGPDSKVGHFPTSLLQEADRSHWQVISMKNDWKRIFPWEETAGDEK